MALAHVTVEQPAMARSASSALINSSSEVPRQQLASLNTCAAGELQVKLRDLMPSFFTLVGVHQTLIKMGVFWKLIKSIESINKTLKCLIALICLKCQS